MRKERLLELLRGFETRFPGGKFGRCAQCGEPQKSREPRRHRAGCEVARAIADLEAELTGTLRVCIRCGCHELDACAIGNIGCHWIGPGVDLCSVCADKTGTEAPSAANGFGFYKRARPHDVSPAPRSVKTRRRK